MRVLPPPPGLGFFIGLGLFLDGLFLDGLFLDGLFLDGLFLDGLFLDTGILPNSE